jgi:hypothetical protein
VGAFDEKKNRSKKSRASVPLRGQIAANERADLFEVWSLITPGSMILDFASVNTASELLYF